MWGNDVAETNTNNWIPAAAIAAQWPSWAYPGNNLMEKFALSSEEPQYFN